ncbi:bacteriohemerythrin [Candidatus Dactylopiibacterium carminicum]|nr:bacteriohemerythrin [Candidatus Dactylopiibacterium carminicum]
MELVRWKSEFNLGLDGIDEQHQTLLDLINEVWRLIIAKADPQAVMKVLEELEHYTREHFRDEEAFMRAVGYKGVEAHVREHEAFVTRIEREKRGAQAAGQLSLDLLRFLENWLIDHIQGSDRAYAEYVQKRSSGSLLSRFFRRFR